MKTFLKILMLLITVAVVVGLVYFLINENNNYKPEDNLLTSGDNNFTEDSGDKISGENVLSGDTTEISGENEDENSGENNPAESISGENISGDVVVSGENISGDVTSGENVSGDMSQIENLSGDNVLPENSGDTKQSGDKILDNQE